MSDKAICIIILILLWIASGIFPLYFYILAADKNGW
jgi:hypothetical protein